MFVPIVFKPNLYILLSAIPSINVLSKPKYCNKVLPLVEAPYPHIVLPFSFSSLINETVLFFKSLILSKKLTHVSFLSRFKIFS